MLQGRFGFSSAALSDVGLIRRVNEDAFLEAPERGLWAVADGMGGHDFGEVASSMLVQALDRQPRCVPLAAFSLAVRNRLQEVNDALRVAAAARGAPMMGATVVALLAVEADCAILWAGDSRAYLMRRGLLRQITRDHRQSETSTPTGTACPPDRITTAVATNVITRAVGATATLSLDETRVPLEDGDIFLLCSDGLTNLVTDTEIAQLLLHGSCRQASQALVNLALLRGGTDNVTVVVVSVTDLCSTDRTVFNPAV